MMLDNGCPQLQEGIHYKAMGLEWYWGIVMTFSYYPGIDDGNNTNWLYTISLSALPADHGIPPATHGISVLPPSPDKSKMLPPPTVSTEGKEWKWMSGTLEGL